MHVAMCMYVWLMADFDLVCIISIMYYCIYMYYVYVLSWQSVRAPGTAYSLNLIFVLEKGECAT